MLSQGDGLVFSPPSHGGLDYFNAGVDFICGLRVVLKYEVGGDISASEGGHYLNENQKSNREITKTLGVCGHSYYFGTLKRKNALVRATQ